jgi:hypothetical protein
VTGCVSIDQTRPTAQNGYRAQKQKSNGAGGRPDDARDENELKSDERDELESVFLQPSVFDTSRVGHMLGMYSNLGI